MVCSEWLFNKSGSHQQAYLVLKRGRGQYNFNPLCLIKEIFYNAHMNESLGNVAIALKLRCAHMDGGIQKGSSRIQWEIECKFNFGLASHGDLFLPTRMILI